MPTLQGGAQRTAIAKGFSPAIAQLHAPPAAAALATQPAPPSCPAAVAWSVHNRLVDAFDKTQEYWK